MPKYKPDANESLRRKSSHRDPKAEDVLSSVQEEEKKRLHAHIPASLHTELKLRAVKEDRDMTELVIEALSTYLAE